MVPLSAQYKWIPVVMEALHNAGDMVTLHWIGILSKGEVKKTIVASCRWNWDKF